MPKCRFPFDRRRPRRGSAAFGDVPGSLEEKRLHDGTERAGFVNIFPARFV